MTVHEPEIQQLAKSSIGGQRFELFIRRWEMNNEPLPPESKPEVPNGRGWSSHGRALDLEAVNNGSEGQARRLLCRPTTPG